MKEDFDRFFERMQQVVADAAELSPEEVFAISVRAGVHNPDGTLTPEYGGEYWEVELPPPF